ncbi:MAG: hypothetical protein ABR923_06900 [Terracidiphilus sp.]|jgi:hypothetical protein
MKRAGFLPILMVAASLAFVCGQMAAQTVQTVTPAQPKAKEITPVVRPVPFSQSEDEKQQPVTFRTVDQMTQKDRDLVADAESTISERAGFMGLEFNGGNWNYEQVVCPAFPNHVLLRFTRNNGTNEESMFSASIPRDGDGRVRIIPIRLKGYSLFSPAPINTLTISAFNHIRSEEHADTPQQWLGIALCYAALTGGHPESPLIAKSTGEQKFPLAMPATLEITTRGNLNLFFVEGAADRRPMEWTMIFDRKGKLLKATRRPAELISSKVLHPAPFDVTGKAIISPSRLPDPATNK